MTLRRQPIKAISVKFDLDTAADLAEFFVGRDKIPQAIQTLKAISEADPRREAVRRRYAELHLSLLEKKFPPGTSDRDRMLVTLMGLDVASEKVATAYFKNLELLLSRRERLPNPGALVLGLGSGRCGSTSLAALFAGVEACCATHENPPLVHWQPTADQIRIHCRRFRLLLDRFQVVFDAAHWWLNAADEILASFEDVKLIGLMREPDACARSFLKIKGIGRNSINHWLDHDGTFWRPGLWDALYPSYDAARHGLGSPRETAKEDLHVSQHRLVRMYVEDYNRSLLRMKDSLGERLLLVRTEEIGARAVQDEIFDFLGLRAPYFEAVLNRETTADGKGPGFRY